MSDRSDAVGQTQTCQCAGEAPWCADAMLSLATLTAYCRTSYIVDSPEGSFVLRIGEANSAFDGWLQRESIESWAFVTAHNPQSQPLSAAENAARHADLLEFATTARWRFWEGEGRGDHPQWPPERSLLLADVPFGAALDVGRRYGQHAIVVGQRGGRAKLRFPNPENARSVLVEALGSDDPVVSGMAQQALGS